MGDGLELAQKAEELFASASRRESGFDFEQRARTLCNALALYRELGDREGQARVLVALGNTASNVADYAQAIDYLHEAEDLASELDDPVLSRKVRGQFFGVHLELGDFPTALVYAKREWDLASQSDDPENRLLALNGLGCVLASMGEHAQGVGKIEESLSYLDQFENEGRRAHIHAQSMADIADAYLKWGKPDQALRHAELGAEKAARIDHPPLVMLNSIYAGRAALALGNPALAVKKLELAVELAGQMGLKSQESHAHLELASALGGLGRHEEALESYRKGHRIEREFRRDDAARRLEFRRARKEIEDANREKQNAERVLFTVLPQAIATRMKEGEKRIADELRDVSLLFADLVGFTAMSTRINPQDLLGLLERIFSEFDLLTASFQLEKVKTIGDAYMAVGGALASAPDHLEKCARLALAMLPTVEQISADTGTKLAIRIGVHAGPAIAGVIGTNRLSYDLWGETVNFASRLESSGIPGRIHVSAIVAERLGQMFLLEPRGPISLKGFGELPTFFLSAPST